MSQRYFLTTESTYEALRLAVDADLGYPTATADSIFTPALQAPRDSLRRIVLAVDDALPGYSQIITRVTPLLANASAQELTEAEYLAFLTCVETSSGSVDAGSITSGTLDAARLPASVVRTGAASAGPIQVYAVTAFPSPPPADPNDYMLFEGYDGVDMTSNISASGVIACAAITLAGTDLATTLSGKAASSHTHAASAINSGTLDIARIPTGTSSTTVATGDHTHSQLHDRSHAITSSSDHTAGNWRLFHSNGSGQVVELAFGNSGQALISNGASAAPSWGSAGSNSASDLTTGTLSDSRLSTNAQAAINLYLWSAFR